MVTGKVAAAWPDQVGDDRVRAATSEDLESLRKLHDAAFPGTHTSADVLVSDAAQGARPVLVAVLSRRVVGYAAGQIQPDGQGYVDYLAVAEEARRQGIGRALLVYLVRGILARRHGPCQSDRGGSPGARTAAVRGSRLHVRRLDSGLSHPTGRPVTHSRVSPRRDRTAL